MTFRLCASLVFRESQILRPCQLRWRDCSSCASSFTPFALNGSHDRCAPRIIRPTSFNALCFWSLGLIIPIRFAQGIIRLTLQTSLRSFSESLINLPIPMRFAFNSGVINPDSLRDRDNSSNKFQCASLLKFGTH